MKKLFASLLITLGFLGIVTTQASAHVVVRPSSVGLAQFQTFTVGVPSEQDNPTTSVKLVIPAGLHHVTPNVKPGWTITVTKTGEGEEEMVTEIIWTGGMIPSGQRDEFLFSAQAPEKESTLIWKAYQTYSSGETVSWDEDPNHAEGSHGGTPYSQTDVVNDLTEDTSVESNPQTAENPIPTLFSTLALALSAGALGLQLWKKKK